jgi:hypothetical protein
MTAMMIPASLRMATLFPCCAIRVNLPALPCRLFEKFEKAFVCRVGVSDVVDSNSQGEVRRTEESMTVWSRALS